MATSGSYDFSITRDQLIDLAHQHVGLIGEGESASSSQVTEASRLLNMIVKLRAADGMPLWALKRGYVLPFTGASSVATDSHVVTEYVSTTISANEAAAQTILSVTSSTGMAASDQVGIELDDGSMHWTTISTVDSSTQITVASGLASAAASGNRVYAYTASSERVQKPIRIVEANILEVSSSNSWEIYIEDRADYYALGNRTNEGTPNTIYYSIESTSGTNLDNGQIFVYPRFANGDYVIEFTYHRPFQDFDAATDNPDFPQAFYLPLMLELAALLGPKANLPIEERRSLFQEAEVYRIQALQTVAPEGAFQIVPTREYD